jgi:hypothetical protein
LSPHFPILIRLSLCLFLSISLSLSVSLLHLYLYRCLHLCFSSLFSLLPLLQDWCWLCGREILSSASHYDSLTGCPGGQFAEAPAFAMWTILPCLRSPYLHLLTRIPSFLFLLLFLPVAAVATIVGGVSAIGLSPLLVVVKLCTKKCCQSSRNTKTVDVVMYTGVAVCGFFIGLYLCVLQLLWFPLSFIAYLLLLVFTLCQRLIPSSHPESSGGERVSQMCSFFCQVWHPDRQGYLNSFWCFPLSSFEYLTGSSIADTITTIYLNISMD